MLKIQSTKPSKVAALIAAGLVAVFTLLFSPSPAQAAVSGTVDCIDKQVLGVWVEAQSPSKRSWASITPIEGNYRYSWHSSKLNQGDAYELHVGCGDWAPSMKTSMAHHTHHDYICKRNWGWEYPFNYCVSS